MDASKSKMNVASTNTAATTKPQNLADFAALCTWLIASFSMAVISYLGSGQDFRGYYAAAQVLASGGNPYNYDQVASVLVNVTGWAGNNPFYYPLWFGWFFVPLTNVPYQTARLIWMIFNLAVWIFGLTRLHQFLKFPQKGWQIWLMNLVATFIFAWTTMKFEQVGILLFTILVEILIAYSRKKWGRMGILLALALIKPNITLLPIAVMVVWLLRNRKFRPVLTMVIVVFGLILTTTLLTPNWYQPIICQGFSRGLTNVLDGPTRVTGVRLTTTLLDWLKANHIASEFRILIYGFALMLSVTGISANIWRSKSVVEVMAISLLANFIIAPYAMQYDFPPLTIVLFWLIALSRNAEHQRIPVSVMLFIASVLFWERPISDGYWIIIGLGMLLTWHFYSKGRYPFHGRLHPSILRG
jgi:hypothetical protein